MEEEREWENWPARRVRSEFLEFFKQKHHEVVPSSPVVPHDDPSLLFANAGMNQFKPIFLGTADPHSKLGKLSRAVDTQKCIRAGGKHNDLDDVGKDTYHHTFFEMLGNWSFGDYFKRHAIHFAFELLVHRFGLPSFQLYATYFEGDESQGVPADDEAKAIWRELLPDSQILPFDATDNFWEMGDTGPCGPCTEIHFDRIGNRDASSLVNTENSDVIEIWNLVFIQFDRQSDGSLKPLPSQHVDTGMGFERMVSIMQNKTSNYDTDVFQPLFNAISHATGAPPYNCKMGQEDAEQGHRDTAYRVVADHLRALSFAIADGASPGNDGCNYVLRRILRRAIRFGRDCLGGPVGFFSTLLPTLQQCMGETFPEIVQQGNKIREELRSEEENFEKTILNGVAHFKRCLENVQTLSNGQRTLPGKDAFMLWDTYGFPLDLTELMAEERDLVVDTDGFNTEMEKQRERSRAAAKSSVGASVPFQAEQTTELAKANIAATDDALKYTWYCEPRCVVQAVLDGYGIRSDGLVELNENEHSEADDDDKERSPSNQEAESNASTNNRQRKLVGVVLDRTPFYAEQGGQVYDTGTLTGPDGQLEVKDVQVAAGYVLHIGELAGERSRIAKEDTLVGHVDYHRRSFIAPNHTMTHMLNLALRKYIGDSVDQKGSLVDPDKLRFDFSSNKTPDTQTLGQIESFVNSSIQQQMSVYSKEVPLDEAFKINGLRAVFGEVYPDPVRVLSVGTPVETMLEEPESAKWRDVSVEFCGGTHLGNTSEAQQFAIVSEESVAKGIRRVIAFTRELAREADQKASELERRIADALELESIELLEPELNAIGSEVKAHYLQIARKARMNEQLSSLNKKLLRWQKQRQEETKKRVLHDIMNEADERLQRGESCVAKQLEHKLDGKVLSEAASAVQKRDLPCVLLSHDPEKSKGKVIVIAAVPHAQADKVPCARLLQAVLQRVDGKGGGPNKANIAQGQGQDVGGIDQALGDAEIFVEQCHME
jgi:alanyl-tRNA synthetase